MLGAARSLGLSGHVASAPDAVLARAFSDDRLDDILSPVLASLDGETRELVLALQPGFPGTFGELKICAAELRRP